MDEPPIPATHDPTTNDIDVPRCRPLDPVSDIDTAVAYYERNPDSRAIGPTRTSGLPASPRRLPAVPRERRLSNGLRQRRTGADVAQPLSMEDVDDLYRRWSASNAKLISAPESKPWGLHEFTAADPDGNLLRVFHDFATPLRATTVEVSRSVLRRLPRPDDHEPLPVGRHVVHRAHAAAIRRAEEERPRLHRRRSIVA